MAGRIGLWHILALAFQLLCPEIWDRSSETAKQSEFLKEAMKICS